MRAGILNRDDLPFEGDIYTFEGDRFGDTPVSFLWVDLPPGGGPRLHQHAYGEIIVIQEGRGTFTLGSTAAEARAGQIVLIPPATPHKFTNSGDGPLRQIDIHLSAHVRTEWLED